MLKIIRFLNFEILEFTIHCKLFRIHCVSFICVFFLNQNEQFWTFDNF